MSYRDPEANFRSSLKGRPSCPNLARTSQIYFTTFAVLRVKESRKYLKRMEKPTVVTENKATLERNSCATPQGVDKSTIGTGDS